MQHNYGHTFVDGECWEGLGSEREKGREGEREGGRGREREREREREAKGGTGWTARILNYNLSIDHMVIYHAFTSIYTIHITAAGGSPLLAQQAVPLYIGHELHKSIRSSILFIVGPP